MEMGGSEWERENLYYMRTHNAQTEPPSFGYQTSRPVHRNNNRIRIFVLGDSFTAGQGVLDLDARWPRVLEDELNRRTDEGTFEVVALAVGGASTITQAAWLENVNFDSGRRGKLRLNGVAWDPKFDVTVIGYVNNDILAESGDPMAVGMDYPEVPKEEWQDIIDGKKPNPQQRYFEEAVKRIGVLADGTIKMWAPLPWPGHGSWDGAEVRGEFERAGFVAVPPRHSKALLEERPLEALIASPGDAHPNTALLRSFALDVADAILDEVPTDRVLRARSGSSAVERPLVSNHHPLHLEINQNQNLAHVVAEDSIAVRERCDYPYTLYAVFCSDGELRESFRGEDVPAQILPCIKMGTPYAQIMLNSNLRPGTEVLVEMIEGPGFRLYGYGYDKDGFETHTDLGILRRGEGITVTIGAGNQTGIILTGMRAGGCPPTEMDLDGFHLSIRIVE